jgi:hypothetical protein
MATEEVLEEVLRVEEIVIVVAAAKLGANEDAFERPESEGAGVVAHVEAEREDEKTEASMVSESLSSSTEFVEEAEEDGRDRSLGAAEEMLELVAESGVWNSSSDVSSLSVSSARAGGEGFERGWSFGKIVWIGSGRDVARKGPAVGSSWVAILSNVALVEW